jgi:hypothetical protein
MDFPVESYIFINRMPVPPPPPPPDASSEVVLNYQRKNMWVGKIMEARAADEHRVFLRVFWLYWPEELPTSTQPYHGQQELILSNHADIVDATTISGAAEVSQWYEQDEDDDRPLRALFFRQTLDLSKQNISGKGGLSALRKHCICRKEYNPDKTMYKCSQADCGIWNHQECLEKELLADLNGLLTKGSLQKTMDRRAESFTKQQQEQEKSLGETIAIQAEDIETKDKNSLQIIEGDTTGDVIDTEAPLSPQSPPISPKKRGRPPKLSKNNAKPEERIQVKVRTLGERTVRNGTTVAKVELLPGKSSSTETKEWTIKVDCLKCSNTLE